MGKGKKNTFFALEKGISQKYLKNNVNIKQVLFRHSNDSQGENLNKQH